MPWMPLPPTTFRAVTVVPPIVLPLDPSTLVPAPWVPGAGGGGPGEAVRVGGERCARRFTPGAGGLVAVPAVAGDEVRVDGVRIRLVEQDAVPAVRNRRGTVVAGSDLVVLDE